MMVIPDISRWYIAKAGATKKGHLVAGVDLSVWTIGVAFDFHPTVLAANAGPLFTSLVRKKRQSDDARDPLKLSWKLRRFVISQSKLEILISIELKVWAIGYLIKDWHNHRLYIGPLNINIKVPQKLRIFKLSR